MVQYTTVRYPCVDVYPSNSGWVNDSEIQRAVLQQARQIGLKGKLSASKQRKAFKKLRAALLVSAIWDPITHPVIKIYFMDGSPKQREWVKKVINESIAPVCDRLTFDWNAQQADSDIRISFKIPGAAYSYIGTQNLSIPKSQHTMNLGWLDDDVQYNAEPYKNTGQVVIHEFCHALGMIHEHQNPKNNPIDWNIPVVIEALQTTNGWDTDGATLPGCPPGSSCGPSTSVGDLPYCCPNINNNMFKKYGSVELCEEAKKLPAGPERTEKLNSYCGGDLVNGSVYDNTSIMHYFFPPEWLNSGSAAVPVNTVLSELDKKWLNKYYGTTPVEEKEEEEDVDEEEEEDVEGEGESTELTVEEKEKKEVQNAIESLKMLLDNTTNMDESTFYQINSIITLLETSENEDDLSTEDRKKLLKGFITPNLHIDLRIILWLLIAGYGVLFYLIWNKKI